MVSEKCIAIIPARGGSKRIPEKSIVPFEGKPMIVWTLEAAQDSGIFDRILVSTDEEKIASVVQENGFEVPFLRKSHADDHSHVSEATIAALQQAQAHYRESYELVVQLMPNCPIRRGKDILLAYENFRSKDVDFQLSCFAFNWMNPWWAFKLNENLEPDYLFPEIMEQGVRSQDLPQTYAVTGSIWIAKAEKLIEAGSFYGPGHVMCPIDWKAATDIDNYEDLHFAKAVFNSLEQ